MSQIVAVMIDTREPDWVKCLRFGGLPILFDALSTGDVQAITDDGHTLIVERKTLSDFLNTLKDDRLFPQLARMTEIRNAQILTGENPTSWAYLVITDPITADHNGKVIEPGRGVTGWSFASVMGTILSIQELGVFVCFANGQVDFEDTVLRLGRRNRNPVMTVTHPREKVDLTPKDLDPFKVASLMPMREIKMLNDAANFLIGLPGVGPENVQKILEWAGGNVTHALIGLTDLEIKSPITLGLRRRLREIMGLSDGENLEVVGTQAKEILQGVKA